MENLDVNQIYVPGKCNECIDGYKGRIAIHEVLEINQEIKDAIVGNVRKDELRKLVYNNSSNTLIKDGLIKVMEGLTSIDEILRVIDIKEDIFNDNEDLKNAFIGKNDIRSNINTQQTRRNPFVKQNTETL